MILNSVQVCAPTTDSTEEQLIEFHNDVQKAISMCMSQKLQVLMGDLNNKFGCGQVDNIVGPFGFGTVNECGFVKRKIWLLQTPGSSNILDVSGHGRCQMGVQRFKFIKYVIRRNIEIACWVQKHIQEQIGEVIMFHS